MDRVGYEAVDRNMIRSSNIVTSNMLAVTANRGGIGTIGVYNTAVANSSTSSLGGTNPENLDSPIGALFSNELSWRGGISRPIDLAPKLLQFILSGSARPSFVVSREVSIGDAPEAYAQFERHEEVKIVISFD